MRLSDYLFFGGLALIVLAGNLVFVANALSSNHHESMGAGVLLAAVLAGLSGLLAVLAGLLGWVGGAKLQSIRHHRDDERAAELLRTISNTK